MINIFKKIYKLSQSLASYIYYNIRYIKKKFTPKEGIYAIVNLDNHIKNDDQSRYLYIICMFLNHAGFNVIVKTHWSEFKSLKKPLDFKSLLLKQNYLFVSNCSAPLNTIVLVQPNTPNHVIHLSYGYHLSYKYNNMIQSGKADCIAPYPMHPDQYKFYLAPAFLQTLKNSNKTMKVFFAGSINESMYAKERIKKFFNVIPRLELIQFILSNFKKSRKLQNDDDKLILKQLLSSTEYFNEVIISEVKTKEEDWLKTLSKTDFFICPPGVRIPWCHNCVEAMSVGAIPILEYADLFYPNLKNMKNCLSYTNFEELKMAIEKALAMEPPEIGKMQKNVLNYYNDYLSINSITKKIITFSNSPQHELKVAFPFIMTKEEYFEGKRTKAWD